MAQDLTASLEDYLETIYLILKTEREARSSEISNRMGVNRTSVTGAMRALKERGLVNYAPYGKITLTPVGRRAAENVFRRHELLKEFMTRVLLASESEADEAACQMEHSVTPPVLERFIDFMEFMDACPRLGTDWRKVFNRFRESRKPCMECESCIENMKATLAGRAASQTGTKNRETTLASLKPGDRTTIVDIEGEGELNKRLIDMGVVPGTPVQVERIASLGDPIDVRIRGYHLTLRKSEAESITVVPPTESP